jgi:hypothetical protein
VVSPALGEVALNEAAERMTAWGQSRHFRDGRVTSAYALIATESPRRSK